MLNSHGTDVDTVETSEVGQIHGQRIDDERFSRPAYFTLSEHF